MKKNILFMIINMNIGGTEKALLNMISKMPKEDFNITILMLENYGGFLDHIPSRIELKYLYKYKDFKHLLNDPARKTIMNYFKRLNLIKGLYFLLIFFLTKIFKNKLILFNSIAKNIPEIEKEYDLAIAYAGPMDFISYFVIKKIKAKKKIQWIHFDVTKIGFDKNFITKIYDEFNAIFVVSQEAKNKLINLIPKIKEKTNVFLNIPAIERQYTNIKTPCVFNEYSGIRILTVGRLSYEKGQDLGIRALLKLKKEGIHVRWYCLGEGNERNNYEKLIKKYGLENDFILLGSNPNPYPYIQQCDIYVQPSRHEGYCITLSEAKSFYKPIITTDFTGAKEQIINNQTGLIVPINEESIYKAVKKLILNKNLCSKFSENLSNEKKEENNEIKKIYNLVNFS